MTAAATGWAEARAAGVRSPASRIAGVGLLALATGAKLLARRAFASHEGREPTGASILSEGCARALRIHGVELESSGPKPQSPALLAANHVSYLDPIAIAALYPCVPVAKAEVSRWPVFGLVARLAGVHFVDRGSREDRARVVSALAKTLRAGVSALNFPEGTTSDGAGTRPFRARGFEAARLAGVPVVPIAVRLEPSSLAWTGDATFLPHYLQFAAVERPRIRIRAGEPLAPSTEPAELAARCRAVIDRLLEEMS